MNNVFPTETIEYSFKKDKNFTQMQVNKFGSGLITVVLVTVDV